MKKRKVKKSVVKLTLRVISVFMIIYFCITTVSYGIKIKVLSDKNNSLNDELINLKENEEKLKTDILKLNDKEYIARYAREHYLYTKEGEFALKIDENKSVETETVEKESYFPVYIASLFAGFILVLLFIFHRKKRKKIVLSKKK